jgi:hypothetical protein
VLNIPLLAILKAVPNQNKAIREWPTLVDPLVLADGVKRVDGDTGKVPLAEQEFPPLAALMPVGEPAAQPDIGIFSGRSVLAGQVRLGICGRNALDASRAGAVSTWLPQ